MTEIVEIDGNKLYFGECEDFITEIGCVDTMVIDPHYDFNTSGGGSFRKSRPYLQEIETNGLASGFDLNVINPLLYRSVVVFCHNDQLHELLPHMAGSFNRHVVCAWHKKNPVPVHNKHYLPDTEFFIHAWNEGGYPLGKYSDKSRYIISNNGKSEYKHPAVKPQDVMDKIIVNVNGETVLDLYMGTGSTGVSAIKHGKKFIGIEYNRKYFDIACERIERAVNDLKKSVDE